MRLFILYDLQMEITNFLYKNSAGQSVSDSRILLHHY